MTSPDPFINLRLLQSNQLDISENNHYNFRRYAFWERQSLADNL
ncbi:hypothetical protein LQF76_13315 [Gloeomargaritales cyanobacterium VI4D9]|nr:hypothetical protein LQF76_13315 [Gloeomargaritales cyanobacterium VI4D9]